MHAVGVANLRQVTAGMVKGVRVPSLVGLFLYEQNPDQSRYSEVWPIATAAAAVEAAAYRRDLSSPFLRTFL